MSAPRFAWDENKNRTNQRKHGVDFEEAGTAFRDEAGLLRYDPKHSDAEERFVLLGLSANVRLLVVAHRYDEKNNTIHIFSARKATKRERRQYEERKP